MVSDFEVKFLLPDGSPAAVTVRDDYTVVAVQVFSGKFLFTFRLQYGHPYRTAYKDLNGEGREPDCVTEAAAAVVARGIFAGEHRRAMQVALAELLSFP